jgi:hypothetical protein
MPEEVEAAAVIELLFSPFLRTPYPTPSLPISKLTILQNQSGVIRNRIIEIWRLLELNDRSSSEHILAYCTRILRISNSAQQRDVLHGLIWILAKAGIFPLILLRRFLLAAEEMKNRYLPICT